LCDRGGKRKGRTSGWQRAAVRRSEGTTWREDSRERRQIIIAIADQLERDRSLQIQAGLTKAAEGLAPLKHSAGLTLLNRIGTQVLNINAPEHRYAAVAATMKEMGPFDPAAAVSELRELADDILQNSLPSR
jgi:hypothetical protein